MAVAIRTELLTESTITDVIGQRLYADALPQNPTLPAIEMTVVSDVPEMQLSDITGLTKARIELMCIADRRTTARALAQAIRTCGIATIKGQYSSVWIRGVAIGESFDATILPTDGSDERRYQTSVHLLVDYMEQ